MAYQPKSYRKFVATAATAAIVASAVAPAASAAGFTDVPARYQDAVDFVVSKGVNGLTATTFGTGEAIKRVDAAVMIAKVLELDTEKAPAAGFTDVPARAQGAVNALKAAGITSGKTATSFDANSPITRGELAIWIQRGFKLEGSADLDFSDVSDRYAEAVKALVANEITSGVSATKFGVAQEAKRGDYAIFLHKAHLAKEAPGVVEVSGVSAINLKQVVVTFSKDVDETTAGNTANYTFASGSGVSVTAAEVNGNKVTLTVSGASQQQTADLTVEGVKVADGTVVDKTTKSVKFVDTVAPTVASVDSIGPKTIKVKFSEPLQSAPTFSLNDGTIAIVSTAFTAGSSEATLTLGTAPASGTYKLTVKDGLDYAGFKIDEVVKEFTFAVDTVAPVLTVKSASPTKVVLTSNEDITGVIDSNVEFFHTYNGVAAYKATKSVNGKEITLNFANPLPEGAFKLFLNYADEKGTQIADLWGNKVAEQTITGTVVSDTTAPTVTKVEADGNTAIKVTFSEAVSGATTAANYEIKDANGDTVAINGSITNISGNIYSIPVAALNGGSYTLTVKNIKDTSFNQNKLADYSTTVSIKDVVPPTVTDLNTSVAGTQAQLLSAKKVKIVFSEAMDKASIENKLNYLFGGAALDSKVTVTAVDNNKAVVLDFTNVASGAQTTPANKTLQVLRVADAAGNPITAASTDVLVPASVTAPLFDKAEVTGKNTIKLYFKEVITSAQAADFLVSNDNGNNYAAAGSISNEVVDGKSVITLTTTQDLPTTAANVLVKTAATVNAKNGFGTEVSLTATSAGDKYAPLATVATAVDNNLNGKVDRFTVKFSEALYVASVQDSDFTVEGYEITGVSVSGDTVTLAVKEKTTNDLAVTPKVTLVGTVEDAARNARTAQDALTAVAAQAGADAAIVANDKTVLALPLGGNADENNIKSALGTLSSAGQSGSTTITWESSLPSVLSNDGKTVIRPIYSAGDANVNFTATITKGAASDTKVFNLVVKKRDFSLVQSTTADKLFQISGDGYAGNQFTVANNFDMDADTASNDDSLTVNGITYKVTYNQTNAKATVTATGTATATATATTKTINVVKDGKTATITLNIPAVNAGDAADTVDFKITN